MILFSQRERRKKDYSGQGKKKKGELLVRTANDARGW